MRTYDVYVFPEARRWHFVILQLLEEGAGASTVAFESQAENRTGYETKEEAQQAGLLQKAKMGKLRGEAGATAYLTKEFPENRVDARPDKDKLGRVFRIMDKGDDRTLHRVKLYRDVLDLPPEKVEQLLARWNVAQMMRGAGTDIVLVSESGIEGQVQNE